jgi:hypothetical protein
LENVQEWWVVLSDKWEVAMKVAVDLNELVMARGNGTFVTNCGEGGWTIYQSGGWWWVKNNKW